MGINALKYKLLEVDLEDIKTTIGDNLYKTAAGLGIAGLTAKQIKQNKKEKKGNTTNPNQSYSEPAEEISIALGSSSLHGTK